MSLSTSGRKYTLGCLMLVGCCMAVYLMYFHKGAPEDIMAANLQSDDTEEETELGDDPRSQSRARWNNYIKRNNFVSIGELYNKCEDDKDRIMVGKTIMLPDRKLGGVKSRTIANITWGGMIDDGAFHLEVSYNNKELYSNTWDVCTVDEDEEDRIIFCPIKPGYTEYVKEKKIPNYLPKGRYVTKARVTNQDGVVVGCAFSDFVL